LTRDQVEGWYKTPQFEEIETDVVKGGGILEYGISLSVQPERPVVLGVELRVREVRCYEYEDKFEIVQKEFTFTPENYDIPQMVIVTVHRLDSSYLGAFYASLEHTINSTDDRNFKSAFLRSVSVALQDDSTCVENARQYDDALYLEGTTIRKCGCMKGFYVEAVDPLFCHSAMKCAHCPEGMNCTFQQQLTEATLLAGYYRTNASSLDVGKCPNPSTQCVGHATSGDELCADGYSGVFCMVCKVDGADSRHVRRGDSCVQCNGSLRATMYVVLVCLGLLWVGALVLIARTRRPTKDASQSLVVRMEAFGEKFQTKYKIMVTFSQILSKVVTEYPMKLPQVFKSFWTHFTVFNIDLALLPLNCIVDSNFHDRLIVTTVAPIVFVVVVVLFWAIQRQVLLSKKDNDGNLSRALHSLTAKSIRVSIIFLYTVFPIVSTTIFQAFIFDQRLGDGSSYLVADYTIQRDDPTHQAFMTYASVMAVLYCFGIPAASFYALYVKRHAIQKLQLASEDGEAAAGGGGGASGVIAASSMSLNSNRTVSFGPGHQQDPVEPKKSRRERQRSLIVQELTEDIRRMSMVKNRSLRSDEGGGPGNADANMDMDMVPTRDDVIQFVVVMTASDPVLVGMSPLYKDYECSYWWFEVSKFVVTLVLCGIVGIIPGDGVTAVFISLLVSGAMMMLFANCQPYLNKSDDVLAQVCQISLTFTLAIGILEKAHDTFQDENYGTVLIVSTSMNLALGMVVCTSDFVFTAFPEMTEASLVVASSWMQRFIASDKGRARAAMVSPMMGPTRNAGQRPEETRVPELASASAVTDIGKKKNGLSKNSGTKESEAPVASTTEGRDAPRRSMLVSQVALDRSMESLTAADLRQDD
jgi:hypothetical protein